MAYEPAMSGEIPTEGMLDVLRQIEEKRISGRLRFTAKNAKGQGETGEVELVAGQLALDQSALPDGTDPVERLLVLRGGIFVVHQRLPPLAVSQGDDQHKKGSLAVHAPSDLMTYCEGAGLTGTLRLINAGSLVDMIYEAGELLGIRVDGQDNADLSHVFSWEDGRFEIAVSRDVRSLVPGGPPEDPSEREPTTQFVRPGANDTGKHFLKVLEVALTDIVDRRERAQHKGRGQTGGPPKPSVRPRPASIAPPRERKPRRDATVRVVILGADDDAAAQTIDRTAGRRGETSKRTPEPRAQERPMAKKETPKTEKPEEPAKAVEADEVEGSDEAETEADAPAKAAPAEAAPKKDVSERDTPKKAPAKAAPADPGQHGAAPQGEPETVVGTLGWSLAVFAIGVVILAALARFAT